jgi:hypothetical protein
MKPLSASDILRKNAPRKFLGQSTVIHQNKFDSLREPSPAPSGRDRLNSGASQKRKEYSSDGENDEVSHISKVSRLDEGHLEEIAVLESKISKVSTMCGRIVTNLQKIEGIEDPLRLLLAEIAESIRMTNEVQEELASKFKGKLLQSHTGRDAPGSYSRATANEDFPEIVVSNARSAADARRLPRGGFVPLNEGSRHANKTQVSSKPVETEEEAKKRKFGEAIRDAERSTLCFNLDMGNVPIMNKNTISEKASMALTKMAATSEGKGSLVPSNDAITAIDDVISLVTNMEFFGSTTKQYQGKGSSGFCTVPVKYQFKDKDQRLYAEKTLREKCNVKCSTPYPAIVRECMKQVVDHVRISHPSDFVRVSVVTKEFALKVSRRGQGKNLKWVDYPALLPLPMEAWDTTAKKVPEGMRMFYLPEESEEMLMSPSHRGKSNSPSRSSRRGSTEVK